MEFLKTQGIEEETETELYERIKRNIKEIKYIFRLLNMRGAFILDV